jgi:hypothetical protein
VGPWPEGPLTAAPLSPLPYELMEQEVGARLAGTVATFFCWMGRSRPHPQASRHLS